jgi:hypothetical protein
MRRRATAALAAAVFGACLMPLARAQDTAPKKSPELEVLNRFIGEWEETVVLKPAAWTPERTTIRNTHTRKWILNGQMIENKGVWSPSKDEFLHLTTYDADQGEYRQFYFDKNNPVSRDEYRGKWDEETKTLTLNGKLANGVRSLLVNRFIDADTFTWTLVAKDRAGTVVLDMESKCVRKK